MTPAAGALNQPVCLFNKDRYAFYCFAELIFAANAGINESLGCWRF
jgi:hypothetical protein